MTYVVAAPFTASIVWPTSIALPLAASGVLAAVAVALVALRAARRRPRMAKMRLRVPRTSYSVIPAKAGTQS